MFKNSMCETTQVKKCKSPVSIQWALGALKDNLVSGAIEAPQVTFRELTGKGRPGNKGLLDEYMLRHALGTHLFMQCQGYDAGLVAWLSKMQSHEGYRKTFGFKDAPADITGMSVGRRV